MRFKYWSKSELSVSDLIEWNEKNWVFRVIDFSQSFGKLSAKKKWYSWVFYWDIFEVQLTIDVFLIKMVGIKRMDLDTLAFISGRSNDNIIVIKKHKVK